MPTGSIQDPYQNFIALGHYARWVEEKGRRETWVESVTRYVDFFRGHLQGYGMRPADPVFDLVQDAITNLEVMPSMRALMTAGPALAKNNLAGFNCSAQAIHSVECFREAVLILMHGTGMGFSVESEWVSRLPVVPSHLAYESRKPIVADSKEGWAACVNMLILGLYSGYIVTPDFSQIRPAGARLKTFGGRASGPEPLIRLCDFIVETFKQAAGRQLSTIEVHDIFCMVGDIVVSGGVRRSAEISLSDLDDQAMASAKNGKWYLTNPYRRLANNSAVYRTKPDLHQFLAEWSRLIESRSGERGIFNLEAMRAHAEKIGRDADQVRLTNPCSEIALRDMGVCNLSEAVVRESDTPDHIMRKVRLATILGTWQSTLTYFPGLRDEWRRNAEEERLLGVSLTGIYGNTYLNNPDDDRLSGLLKSLREVARETNRDWADRLGINPSVAITCVKPSGTVSQLTDVSSGIHPWHAAFYVRRVRANKTDPLAQMLIDQGVPHEDDVMAPDKTVVFSFPRRAPRNAVLREQVDAIAHLRLWSIYRTHWTDHNPSVTINVRDDEWIAVADWVWRNWDDVGGISFMPHEDHVYAQAPYEEVDEDTYRRLVAEFPDIDWTDLSFYEIEDTTTGSQELSCSGGACEVVDLSA